jgi:threonine dehydrogenase-like Zn-dependent dehydrogenase
METAAIQTNEINVATEAGIMQAVVITAPGQTEITTVPVPEPGKGEVRIKLEGSGLCASNIPVWEGREWFSYPVAPGNPGHEGWGYIDTLGQDVAGLRKGDRVAFLSNNAYAEYDIAKADDVVVLPAFLDKKPFPGEPLGCAMNIFDRSDIKRGQTIAIVGAGFLGALLIQLAKSAGAHVIAVSQREFSLEIAKKCGADYMIPMDDHNKIIEKVKDITFGRFCDRVIEVTGKEWPLNLSIELTAERGKLIVAGFHQDGMRQVNMQLLNWRGIDMVNAHERDPKQYIKGMRHAIRAIENGDMDPFPLFTHTFSMDNAGEAFRHLKERPNGFIKALLING